MNLSADEFEQLRILIHENCGLALTADKKYLVSTRLEPVARKHLLKSYGELIQRLRDRGNGFLRDEVVEAMATNETSFNRDGYPFEELRRSMLPGFCRILGDRRSGGIPFPKIRIWSAAASTGQEPYSIAMAVTDYCEQNPQLGWTPENFSILASDISERALQVARAGSYSAWELERGMHVEQRSKYFIEQGDRWQIVPAIKKIVEFRRVNICENIANLVNFDLVFCRNLLIYFDEATRQSIYGKLVDSLVQGGQLVVGSAEHIPATMNKALEQKPSGRSVVYVKR